MNSTFKLRSLSNDDGDINKNGKKNNRFRLAKQQLCVHRAFLNISLLSLHDYDMKMPDFTFCGGHEHQTMTFFFFC